MSDLLTALALILVIEGLLIAVFPSWPLRALAALASAPPEKLRVGGVVMLAAGVFFVWLLRR